MISILPVCGATPPPKAPLAGLSLDPALKAAAEREGITLYHIDPTGPDMREGDMTVAWVGATDGKLTRQWLIQFRRGAATAHEPGSSAPHDVTKYLSWGPVVTFHSTMQPLDLWIAGPVTTAPESSRSGAPVAIKRRRILVPADYLELGLDNSIRVEQHIRQRTAALSKDDPHFSVGHLYILDKPVRPQNVAYAKPVAEKIGFSPEMERAWAGGYVALQAFYDLANAVPEIEAIATVALDKPSLWKLAKMATGTMFKTGIGGPSTLAIDPVKAGLIPVATEVFDAPFSFGFGKDPIVSGRLVVSSPTPPFDTSAGLIALLAAHPKDSARIVQVVIISAVRGPASASDSGK